MASSQFFSLRFFLTFEALIVKAASLYTDESAEALKSRVDELERKLRSGNFLTAPAAPKPAPTDSEIQKRLTDFAGTDTQSDVIEANLFSDVPFPEADERAEALMGQLITEMRKERRMLLYSALEAQSSYHIEGDEFIINATDPASRNMLTEEHNLKVLNEAAFRLSGLKFKVTGGFAGGKTKHTAEDRVKLYELMGDKLRDKK